VGSLAALSASVSVLLMSGQQIQKELIDANERG